MRRRRIHTPQPLAVGDELQLEPQAARHVSQVLRLRRGTELLLFNGDGRDWSARLLTDHKRDVRVAITGCTDEEPPPLLQIHLGLGISKGERMDLAVQKAVELGVDWITPLQTERSVVRLSRERMEKRMRHWQGIMIAACEQSGRRRLPELLAPIQLEAWLSGVSGTALLLDHRADHTLNQLPAPEGRVHLLVGPEGGLSEQERTLATRQGFSAVRLGPRVLRTETAPLAAIAALQILWGDFRY